MFTFFNFQSKNANDIYFPLFLTILYNSTDLTYVNLFLCFGHKKTAQLLLVDDLIKPHDKNQANMLAPSPNLRILLTLLFMQMQEKPQINCMYSMLLVHVLYMQMYHQHLTKIVVHYCYLRIQWILVLHH